MKIRILLVVVACACIPTNVQALLKELGQAVHHVVEGAGEAVREIGEGVGEAVEEIGEGAHEVVEGTSEVITERQIPRTVVNKKVIVVPARENIAQEIGEVEEEPIKY